MLGRIGRKELSALLLAVAVLLTCSVALLAVPSEAQQGGSPGENRQDTDCPGASRVNTTTGTGNTQSPVFNITGTSLRLTVDSTSTSDDPQFAGLTVYVYPEGETADFASNFAVEEGRDDSSIVNAGPGRFYLDIFAANVEYTINVDSGCKDLFGGQRK